MTRFLFYPDRVKDSQIYLDIAEIKINSLYVDYVCFSIYDAEGKILGELWLEIEDVRNLRMNLSVDEDVLLVSYFNREVLDEISNLINQGEVFIDVVKEKCDICENGVYKYDDVFWFCDFCAGTGYKWRVVNYGQEKD